MVVDPLPSFEVIGRESLLQWPGTREGARQEGLAKDGLKVVVTATADTCVRAFVHATASVSVTLANSTTSLAEGKGNALALGGKGPVCVHKGDVLTVSVQGDARARVIVRQSP